MQHGQPKWPKSAREQSLTLNQGLTRRSFFERVVDGLGGTALMALLNEDLYGGAKPLAAALPKEFAGLQRRSFDLAPRAPRFAAKARAVIELFMNGGPSQVVLFDP